jgi:hypothetical protein
MIAQDKIMQHENNQSFGEKSDWGENSEWGESQTGEKSVRLGRKVRLGRYSELGRELRLFAIRLGFKKSPRLYSTETLSSLIAVDSPHIKVCLQGDNGWLLRLYQVAGFEYKGLSR